MSGLVGKTASNLDNVSIPHGISFFFKRTGTSNWLDLGVLEDVNVTPTAEFLDFESARKGVNSVAKRLLTKRGLTVDCTLDEINIENLRLATYAGAAVTGSINVLETATPLAVSETWTLPETPANVLVVVSADGGTTYAVTVDYTLAGAVITAVSAGAMDGLADDTVIHVTYDVAFATGTTMKIEMLDTTTIEGAARFQVRNNEGGFAQIFQLDDVQISPNGAIPMPSDAVQSLPLTIVVQELNGQFGRIFMKDI